MRVHALFLVVIAGCGPTVQPPRDAGADSGFLPIDAPCAQGDASVTLGTGRSASTSGFLPLGDGDTVYLTPGPQGGQHIWIGLRGRGFDGTSPLVHLRAFRASDNELIGQLRLYARMNPAPEDASLLALAAQTLVIDNDRYCSVLGGDVRVTLDFNDRAGRCLHVERTLRIGGIDPLALELDRTAWMNCCTQFHRRCYPNGPPGDASLDASLDASD